MTSRPILVVGSVRSGTSVLTWSLGQHSNIALLPETVWFPVIARAAQTAFAIGTARGEYSHLSNALYPEGEFMAEFGRTIDRIALASFEKRIERHLPGLRGRHAPPSGWAQNPQARLLHHPAEPKRRWVDGTPENSFHGYALARMFPEARFIHALRDPLDVAASLVHFDRAGRDAVVRLGEESLRVWMRYTGAAWHIEQALGASRVHRVRNEHLRADGASTLRACLEFLDEPYSENCLLPLMGSMNSSKVTDQEKAVVRGVLEQTKSYRTARTLYDRITASPVPDLGSETVFAELRETFDRDMAIPEFVSAAAGF